MQNTAGNNTVYLGLGSNIGDREGFLLKAIEELAKVMKIEKKSSIYESEAVDFENQEDFLNMVIKGSTKLSTSELIEKTKDIERKLGREKVINKGPRKIDIDILFFNKEIIDIKGLKIPHPAIAKRNFVLRPLAEIDGKLLHPVLKEDIETLLKKLKTTKNIKIWTKKE